MIEDATAAIVREWVASPNKAALLTAHADKLRASAQLAAAEVDRMRVLIVCADVEGIPRSDIARLLRVNRSAVYRALQDACPTQHNNTTTQQGVRQ